MITGPERVTSSEPGLQGDRDSLKSEGLAMTNQRLACGGYTYEGGHQAMTSLLRNGPDLDGVFSANDLSALGAGNPRRRSKMPR